MKNNIEDYCKRTGDTSLFGRHIIKDDIHGFMTYDISGDEFVVCNMYGDGRHWESVLLKLARNNGCKKIKFGTKKNPKSFERKYKCKVVGYIMEREV